MGLSSPKASGIVAILLWSLFGLPALLHAQGDGLQRPGDLLPQSGPSETYHMGGGGVSSINAGAGMGQGYSPETIRRSGVTYRTRPFFAPFSSALRPRTLQAHDIAGPASPPNIPHVISSDGRVYPQCSAQAYLVPLRFDGWEIKNNATNQVIAYKEGFGDNSLGWNVIDLGTQSGGGSFFTNPLNPLQGVVKCLEIIPPEPFNVTGYSGGSYTVRFFTGIDVVAAEVDAVFSLESTLSADGHYHFIAWDAQSVDPSVSPQVSSEAISCYYFSDGGGQGNGSGFDPGRADFDEMGYTVSCLPSVLYDTSDSPIPFGWGSSKPMPVVTAPLNGGASYVLSLNVQAEMSQSQDQDHDAVFKLNVAVPSYCQLTNPSSITSTGPPVILQGGTTNFPPGDWPPVGGWPAPPGTPPGTFPPGGGWPPPGGWPGGTIPTGPPGTTPVNSNPGSGSTGTNTSTGTDTATGTTGNTGTATDGSTTGTATATGTGTSTSTGTTGTSTSTGTTGNTSSTGTTGGTNNSTLGTSTGQTGTTGGTTGGASTSGVVTSGGSSGTNSCASNPLGCIVPPNPNPPGGTNTNSGTTGGGTTGPGTSATTGTTGSLPQNGMGNAAVCSQLPSLAPKAPSVCPDQPVQFYDVECRFLAGAIASYDGDNDRGIITSTPPTDATTGLTWYCTYGSITSAGLWTPPADVTVPASTAIDGTPVPAHTAPWTGTSFVTVTDGNGVTDSTWVTVGGAAVCKPGDVTPPTVPGTNPNSACQPNAFPSITFSGGLLDIAGQFLTLGFRVVYWAVVPPQCSLDAVKTVSNTYFSTGIFSLPTEVHTALSTATACGDDGPDQFAFWTVADFASGCPSGGAGIVANSEHGHALRALAHARAAELADAHASAGGYQGNLVQRSQQRSSAEDAPHWIARPRIAVDTSGGVVTNCPGCAASNGPDSGVQDMNQLPANFGSTEQLQIFPTVLDLSSLHTAIVITRVCMAIVAWVYFGMHIYRMARRKLGIDAARPDEGALRSDRAEGLGRVAGDSFDAGDHDVRWNDSSDDWERI